MGGLLAILSFIFIKETLYIPNAKKLAPPTNFKERLERIKFNPVSTILLSFDPLKKTIINLYFNYYSLPA